MLRIAVPNKGSLSGPAADMLHEAGYQQRRESKELRIVDPENEVEFFYLRPRDIAIYVSSGRLDIGITGRDLLVDSGADAEEILPLGFARSTFRFASKPGAADALTDLTGKTVATSYEGIVAKHLADSGVTFNASFILGGQIAGEPPRLFRLYAEGNFIEATRDTPFFQTGETKYGKPVLDRVITRDTSLAEGAKCVLVSFDSTMRSNLSVGLPIDLVCYRRDSLRIEMRRRFEEDDAYFASLSAVWSEGLRRAFSGVPELTW